MHRHHLKKVLLMYQANFFGRDQLDLLVILTVSWNVVVMVREKGKVGCGTTAGGKMLDPH